MKYQDIKAFMARNKCKVFITLLGLIAAVLMLSIGFFRTLLIIFLTGICFLYGSLVDKHGFSGANKMIGEFFKGLFGRR